jgi:hypothetical protein
MTISAISPAMLLVLFFALSVVCAEATAVMPLPWTRELSLTTGTPYMTGNDVVIFQNLVIRDIAVSAAQVGSAVGVFDEAAEQSTVIFQEANGLKGTGVFDATTAQLLLELHSADGECVVDQWGCKSMWAY